MKATSRPTGLHNRCSMSNVNPTNSKNGSGRLFDTPPWKVIISIIFYSLRNTKMRLFQAFLGQLTMLPIFKINVHYTVKQNLLSYVIYSLIGHIFFKIETISRIVTFLIYSIQYVHTIHWIKRRSLRAMSQGPRIRICDVLLLCIFHSEIYTY